MSFYTKNKEGVLVEIPMEKVETLLNNDVKVYSDKDLISKLGLKIEKLQEENKILREALEFYSKTNHWLGLTDKVPFDITKWIRIVEDDMDQNNIGGKRAREALTKVGE